MRSHGLRQLVDDKSVANCLLQIVTRLLQVADFQKLLSAGLMQVCNLSASDKLHNLGWSLGLKLNFSEFLVVIVCIKCQL